VAPTVVAPTIDPTAHVGGTLTVTGDRPGSLTLVGENQAEAAYTLEGSGDRITFASDDAGELFVDYLIYDGLDFYLDPGDCRVAPLEIYPEVGIGTLDVTCSEITDLRDNATVTVAGIVGVASSLTGLRHDLPEPGGTITVTGEMEALVEVAYAAWDHFPEVPGFSPSDNVTLLDEAGTPVIGLRPVAEGELELTGLLIGDTTVEFEDGTCRVPATELAVASPDVSYHELVFACPAVELPAGGTVALEGTVVAIRTVYRP
jgi:hypothetical protein